MENFDESLPLQSAQILDGLCPDIPGVDVFVLHLKGLKTQNAEFFHWYINDGIDTSN